MKRLLSSIALAGLVAASAHAADFDATIAEARDKVQQSQFTPALDAVRRARALNPKDFRSWYYEAMALLGLGRKDEARQAVLAAQERAPASAKASLDKLAQMAGDTTPEPAKEAAPAAGLVVVSCSLVETNRKDTSKRREFTRTWRLERGNFQLWDEERAEWSRNQCVLANAWNSTDKYVDIVHRCETSDQRFEYISRHKLDDANVSATWSINRMTGNYAGEFRYDSGDLQYGNTTAGTCRAVKDPSAEQKQKF